MGVYTQTETYRCLSPDPSILSSFVLINIEKILIGINDHMHTSLRSTYLNRHWGVILFLLARITKEYLEKQ
jgi:hypothetical protein